MTEQQLRRFFQMAAGRHSQYLANNLPVHLSLMRRYPHIVSQEIHHLSVYFTTSPREEVPGALELLREISVAIPEARSQIIADFGPILREEKSYLPDHPTAPTLIRLLDTLGQPVSGEVAAISSIARALVVLREPAVLVVGAGMSYDRMPITSELAPLLARFLARLGEENPMALIDREEDLVWERVKQAPDLFQSLFAGKTLGAVPDRQHRIAADLMREGHLAQTISFNWDDLIERAWMEKYGEAMRVIRSDGISADAPCIWKLHGDVVDFGERWVFPNESGRVFRSLTRWVDGLGHGDNQPSHALIVGYRESEPIVREQLIERLEAKLTVVRVRPNIETGPRAVAYGAREFFEALRIEIDLQKRAEDRR